MYMDTYSLKQIPFGSLGIFPLMSVAFRLASWWFIFINWSYTEYVFLWTVQSCQILVDALLNDGTES